MEQLERKIPPVAVFIVMVVIINYLSRCIHLADLPLPLPGVVFGLCFLLAGGIGIAGVYEFRKADTTVNPVTVDKATSVVDSGIFSYTRNPMYLALFLLLFGYAYWHQNLLGLVISFGFIVYMNRFQIQPEEQALERLFGEEYLDYKQRVRRWI
ncbi:isoprenylcysteine carboxylmethyltransferase family protein [Vibrio sinensis]|uniref:Isoprenylcysteine carboxylmethyltransferase family protein n=1 Tax=Vibrio sinensis TaxID=2302434 RepID=A0A3A6R7E3_9VIBR|nr:isoprenylcysteine carboxylmethyltransferase family protein [Vibrio sinensis]RJX72952.1 isoprenylcysteine carboxylmethyltransferase family protein [Vibrio sinensis]